MVRIDWNEHALEDLKEIREYITRDSKNYANLFVKKIYDAVQKLKDFPEIGRIVPEINNSSIREIIFQNYRIIYRTMIDHHHLQNQFDYDKPHFQLEWVKTVNYLYNLLFTT